MKTTRFLLWSGCVLIGLCLGATPCVAQEVNDDPDTLFLTWFGDPTTTIVAQWLEEGEPLPLAEGATDELPGFDVPKMEGVTVDGKADDWDGRGFEVAFLAGAYGAVYETTDLSAKAKIGWDDRGLLVLITVRDDVADESGDAGALWAGDSVEMFISTGVDSDQRYQLLVSPGADAKQKESRQGFYDYRRDRDSGELQAQSACTVIEGGYVVEARLPWSNLGVSADELDEVGFQFYVDDRDGKDPVKVITWHPSRDSNEQPESVYGLKLADKAGAASKAQAMVHRNNNEAVWVMWADASLAGKRVRVTSGDVEIGEFELKEEDGRAWGKLALDTTEQEARLGTISAVIDGQAVAHALPQKWMTVRRPQPVDVMCVSYLPPGEGEAARPTAAEVTTEVKPFGFGGSYVQRATFEGLVPGGEYELMIGGGDAEGHRFRTAPATLDGPMVFATGGDVGTSKHVGQLHREAAKWSPAFGLVGGDCAYANGRTPRRWVEYLQIWRERMVDPDGRLIPMMCAIGNHEVDGSYGQPRGRAPLFLALFDGMFPEHTYSAVDFGDYMSLVMLDSGHVCAHGGEQAAWLEQALASRADRDHLFTIYHVPAYPSHRDFGGKYSALAREHWVPLFEQYGVDVSFENHDHTYKRTHHLTGGEPDPQGVLYLGDGCWGRTPRTVASPEDRPYLNKSLSSRHVIRVTLDEDGTHFLAVDEHGNEIDRYEME